LYILSVIYRQQVALAGQKPKQEVQMSTEQLQNSKKQARKAKKENCRWHEQMNDSQAAEEDFLTERASSRIRHFVQRNRTYRAYGQNEFGKSKRLLSKYFCDTLSLGKTLTSWYLN
jgi:hypothetical protein